MNVELMTIEAALEMIQKAKDMYSGDYEDIDIVHGGGKNACNTRSNGSESIRL